MARIILAEDDELIGEIVVDCLSRAGHAVGWLTDGREALSLLVIVRLPFSVPTDPIYQARSALFDMPFDEYALPQAVLRFRQGFGRLIRSRTDRGVLIVLDKRLTARRYGEVFLRSLPRCTVENLAVRQIPEAIERWLAPRPD